MSATVRYLLERVSQPEIEPITLAEAKRHIRGFANQTSEDSDIEDWIVVARQMIEHYTARALVDQRWKLTVDTRQTTGDAVGGYSSSIEVEAGACLLATRGVYLRRSPVLDVVQVATIAEDGEETVVDPAHYALRDAGTKAPRVVPISGSSWINGPFAITFRAGYADRTGSPITGAEAIPACLKHGVKLLIGVFDENRSPIVIGSISGEIPIGIRHVVEPENANLGLA